MSDTIEPGPAEDDSAIEPLASETALIEPGNIDVHARERIPNQDGGYSTVASMSFGTDDGEALVPTAADGRMLSQEEAFARYKQTGEHLGIFKTPEAATAYAQALHEEQAVEYAEPSFDDRQTEARLAGYSWPEIGDHLDGRMSAAMAEGYTEREVRDYLRLPDPTVLQDRLRAGWNLALGEDPASFIEPPPKPMAVTPIEGMSAARMAAHAGPVTAPNPRMPEEGVTDLASSFNLADQQARQTYADALLKGEVRTPLDFAERYAGAFWGALADRGIELDGSGTSSLVRAGRSLADLLPSNEELTDTAIAVAHASSMPLVVDAVRDTKENLADYWAEMGVSPADAHKEALYDPMLEDALTSPPSNAPPLAPLPPPEDADLMAVKADIGLSMEDLQKPGRDRINPVSMFGEPVEHKSLLGDLEDLGITVIVGGVGGHYVFKAGAAVVGSIIKSAGGQYVISGIGRLFADDTGAGLSIPARGAVAEVAQAGERGAAVDMEALARTRAPTEIREQTAGFVNPDPAVRAVGRAAGPEPTMGADDAAKLVRADMLRTENVRSFGGETFFERHLAEQVAAIPRPGDAIKRLMADESGAVEITPGRITSAIASDLQSAIDRLGKARGPVKAELPLPAELTSAELKPIVTRVEDDLNRLRTNATADKVVLTQMLDRMPATWLKPTLQEKISAEVEARMLPGGRAIPASAEVREVLDGVKSLTDRQTELGNMIRAKTAGMTLDDPSLVRVASTEEGYVHRVVKGKEPRGTIADPQTEMDVITGGAIGAKGTLSKFAPGMQHRTMYALESGDGARVWGAKPLNEIADPATGKGSLKFGDAIETTNGARWTVRPATMDEVEANTPVRYHKNFLANTVENVAKLERVNRNLDFLATTGKELETQGLFVKGLPGAAVRPENAAGMEAVNLPGMTGWAHPKIAYPLNEFFDASKGSLEGFLTKANRFILGSLFMSPVVHAGNVAMHWAPGRGWDWIKPKGYGSLMRDGLDAMREVWTQGPRYVEHLREGSGLLYASTTTENFHQMILTKLFHEQAADPKTWGQYAKALGVLPIDLIKAEYRWSRRTLWAANDMFMLQRQFELQRNGQPVREAIFQAEKDIPNYRIPSEVMGANVVAEFMKSPNAMVFGRYRYGQVRALALAVNDLVGPKATYQERVDAAGKLTMLGVLGLVAYPLLNNGEVGGGLEAEHGFGVKPFGPYSLINAAAGITSGQKDWVSAVSSFVGLAPLIDIARRITTNRDVWGRKVVDDKATWQGRVVQGLEAVAQTFPPAQILMTAARDGNFNRAVGGLIGTTFKKPTDEPKKTKWDAIEQARAYARERADPIEQWLKRQFGVTDVTTQPKPERQRGPGRPAKPKESWYDGR